MIIAPAFYIDLYGLTFPEYKISQELYASEEQAKHELGWSFVKWLDDTPYALDIHPELYKLYAHRWETNVYRRDDVPLQGDGDLE